MLVDAFNRILVVCTIAMAAAATALGADVVEVARSFPDGGGYDRTWKGPGAPDEVRFKDQRILAKGEHGSYCCGFTFAVVMRSAEERGLLADKSVDQIRLFQKQWYGATDEDQETLCVFAAEKLDVGRRVDADDAQPGDFLQFWRASGSGHSVVFLEWIEDDGRRIGFKYRSSQGATDGIGDRIEYLVGAPGKQGSIDPERMHFCRLHDAAR